MVEALRLGGWRGGVEAAKTVGTIVRDRRETKKWIDRHLACLNWDFQTWVDSSRLGKRMSGNGRSIGLICGGVTTRREYRLMKIYLCCEAHRHRHCQDTRPSWDTCIGLEKGDLALLLDKLDFYFVSCVLQTEEKTRPHHFH